MTEIADTTISETHRKHISDDFDIVIEFDRSGNAYLRIEQGGDKVELTSDDYSDLTHFWDELTNADG